MVQPSTGPKRAQDASRAMDSSLSMSTPGDIFPHIVSAGGMDVDEQAQELLYNDALKNSELRRIEFKETIRGLQSREKDFMVVYGGNVGRYQRSTKLHTHTTELWRMRDANLTQVVNNHITFNDDHPHLHPQNESALKRIRDASMAYFRNIANYQANPQPRQNSPQHTLHNDPAAEPQDSSPQKHTQLHHQPTDQPLKPYDFVDPQKQKPLLSFVDLDTGALEENHVTQSFDEPPPHHTPHQSPLFSKRSSPSVAVQPPLTYRDHINPTDDQRSHPLMTPIPTSRTTTPSSNRKRPNSVSSVTRRKYNTASHARPASAAPVRRKSILKTSDSFSINSPLANTADSPSSRAKKPRPKSAALSRRQISFSASRRTHKRPNSRQSSQFNLTPGRPKSARVTLKEPVSEEVIERVSTARRLHVPSRSTISASSHRRNSSRSSVFLTDLDHVPKTVRTTNSARLHSSKQGASKHRRNSNSKQALLSSLKKKNIPSGTTSFPSEELHDSNLRIKAARSGKVFVRDLVKLPDLHILFPEIQLRRKRTLRSGMKSVLSANTLAKRLQNDVRKTQEVDPEDEDAEAEISNFRSIRNRERIEKLSAEYLQMDREMTLANEEIFRMCSEDSGKRKSLHHSDADSDEKNNANQDKTLDPTTDAPSSDKSDTSVSRARSSFIGTQKRADSARRRNPDYWKLQFGATQIQAQSELLNQLDQRYLDRRAVYQSRHLEQVVRRSIGSAQAWNMSRSSARDGQLWRKARESLEDAEHQLHQCAMFYSMLRDFCSGYNIPESSAQKRFLDGIRRMLIAAFRKKGSDFYLSADLLFFNLELAMLQDRKSIKLIHWMRELLDVSLRDFFSYLEQQDWMKDVHSDLLKIQQEVQ